MSWRNITAGLLVVLTAIVLQTALLNRFIPGVSPDLLIALVTAAGLVGGPPRGAVTGLFCGLFTDLMVDRLLGLGTISMVAAGLISGLLGQGLFRENFVVPFLVGGVVTACRQSLFYLGALAFGVHIPFGESLTAVVIPSICYNGLLTGLLFPLWQRLVRRLYRL